MYIAYSNSYENSTHHRFQSTTNKTINRFHIPKKIFRFVIALLILTLVFSFGVFVQAYAGNADLMKSNNLSFSSETALHSDSSSIEAHTSSKIVVNHGDTLWDIASVHVPKGQNVRSYIANIKKLNGLTSSSIHEGDALILP